MSNSPVGPLVRLIRARPLVSFFILTYLLALVALVPQVLFALGLLRMNAPFWYLTIAVCSPATAAIVVQWFSEGNLKICRIYDRWSSLLLGIIFGSALILLSSVIVPAMLANRAPLQTLNWHALLSPSSYHCQYSGQYYAVLLALFEEPGWRGFALPRLQNIVGPVWASLIIGFLWAGWHFPTFLINGLNTVQILSYSLVVLGLSVLMSFGANLSRFSIVVAVVMHAACDTRGCLIERLATNASEKTHGQLIWIISSLLIPVAIILVTRGRLGVRQSPASFDRS